MKMQGPVEVEIKISIASDEEKLHGTVTIGMIMGEYPSEQQIRDRVFEFENNEMPDGFRLMNKREFFQKMLFEKTGSRERFAIPGSPDWDR